MADVKLKELVINECSSVPSAFEPNQLYLTPDTTEEDIVDLQNNKQDVISDLDTIRSGAGKGATAVQPDELNGYALKTQIPTKTSELINNSGFVYQDINVNTINTQYTTSESDIQVSTVFNFEKQSTPVNTRQRSVCYGNGYWVSCGLSGSLIYSTNGINWESITPFCNGTLTGITYGNGYFICVEYETGNVWKANKPHGDWEVIYTENSKIESVQYINNIFLITGENGMISLSEKGYIWNKKETGVTNNIIKATYGNGIYVAVGSGGLILTSINGNDWSIQESGITTDIRTASYGNGRFICGGKSLLYSLNGINWQEATIPEAITGWIREFTYGEKRYYCSIYTSDGLGQIWYSNDAITWTKALNITTSNSRLWCITYGNGLFLSSGDNGMVYTLNLGNTWTYNIPNLSSNDYLWYRTEIIQNNGSKLYSDAYYIKIPNTLDFATKEELNDKQDVIPDLSTIRTGAENGNTAVQPDELSNYATKSYVDYSLINGTPTVTGSNAEISLQDRAITTVTVDDTVSLLTFVFPEKTDGKARDFFVRLVVVGESIPTLSFIELNGDSVPFDVDDDSWAEIEQGVNILMFTDTGE